MEFVYVSKGVIAALRHHEGAQTIHRLWREGRFGAVHVPPGYEASGREVVTRTGYEKNFPTEEKDWSRAWAVYLTASADNAAQFSDAKIVLSPAPENVDFSTPLRFTWGRAK